jgi:hypothetical protein
MNMQDASLSARRLLVFFAISFEFFQSAGSSSALELTEILGEWNNLETSENIRITKDQDIFDTRLGQGRIASTVINAANYVITYQGGTYCWYYITINANRQMVFANRSQSNSTSCLKGAFSRVATSEGDQRIMNVMFKSVLGEWIPLGTSLFEFTRDYKVTDKLYEFPNAVGKENGKEYRDEPHPIKNEANVVGKIASRDVVFDQTLKVQSVQYSNYHNNYLSEWKCSNFYEKFLSIASILELPPSSEVDNSELGPGFQREQQRYFVSNERFALTFIRRRDRGPQGYRCIDLLWYEAPKK